jgi:hypothetical protein
LVIKDGKKAERTSESTSALAPGKTWPQSLLPRPYSAVSPLSAKWVDESTNMKVEGPNLTVHWPAERLVDWAPKSIPVEFIEKRTGSENTITYILNGDRLISTDGKRKTIWQRVR